MNDEPSSVLFTDTGRFAMVIPPTPAGALDVQVWLPEETAASDRRTAPVCEAPGASHVVVEPATKQSTPERYWTPDGSVSLAKV